MSGKPTNQDLAPGARLGGGNFLLTKQTGFTILAIIMNQSRSLSLPSAAFLLISMSNLFLIGVAAWNRDPESATPTNPPREKLRALSLILLSVSQLLYLLVFFVWFFRLTPFHRGNPVGEFINLCGGLCSIAALFVTPFGNGPHRFAMTTVAVTTTFMWLLAAVASVAG